MLIAALADREPRDADIADRWCGEDAVEPVEEPAERTARFLASAAATSRQSAGLRVSALKAERMTEMAMVTANCW